MTPAESADRMRPSHEERCAIGQTIEKARAITLIARAIASTKENA